MDWFRIFHGACFDPKLSVVARLANSRLHETLETDETLGAFPTFHAKTGDFEGGAQKGVKQNETPETHSAFHVSAGHVAAIWLAVLDHASQSKPRGSVASLDPETIALAYGWPDELVGAVLFAMRKKGMIDDKGMVASWAKRQGLSTDRVRRHREMKQNETPETLDREKDRKKEGKEARARARTLEAPPLPKTQDGKIDKELSAKATELIKAFDRTIREVWGAEQARPFPAGTDSLTAAEWINRGVTADLVGLVCRPIFERKKAKGEGAPKTLSFCNGPLADFMAGAQRATDTPPARPVLKVTEADRAKAERLRASMEAET